MIYLKLFFIFFKIGLFSIGGGLAVLPLLREVVIDGNWMTETEFIDMVAIAQSAPGPIGVNMTVYSGYAKEGVLGGIIAALGLVSPAIIIILIIAKFMKNYAENKTVKKVLSAIRPASVGLIVSATLYIFGNSIFHFSSFPNENWVNIKALILFTVFAVIYKLKPLNPIFFLIAGAVSGIFLF